MQHHRSEERRGIVNIPTVLECDMCRVEHKGSDWDGNKNYDVVETRIEFTKGVHYPDGPDVQTTFAELCPKCFTEVLIPWLQEQGVTIQTRECY